LAAYIVHTGAVHAHNRRERVSHFRGCAAHMHGLKCSYLDVLIQFKANGPLELCTVIETPRCLQQNTITAYSATTSANTDVRKTKQRKHRFRCFCSKHHRIDGVDGALRCSDTVNHRVVDDVRAVCSPAT
jgi:hypothetical protein